VLPKAKQSEDAATKVVTFGTITTKVTINSASEVKIAAKALKFELE
jgi:hypothetical protein